MDKEQLKHKILSKTVKTSTCWFYTGTKASGYGTITVDGKRILAHRIMYEAVNGAIPDGKEIDHLCIIRHCVNPEHLQAVTHLENTRRGPQYKDGDQNHLAPSRKKTFLLYIHNERFRDEKKKSELVNKLLEGHYRIQDNIVTVNKALSEAPTPTENRYGVDSSGSPFGPVSLKKPDHNKLCKIHKTRLDNRGRCLQKGCRFG